MNSQALLRLSIGVMIANDSVDGATWMRRSKDCDELINERFGRWRHIAHTCIAIEDIWHTQMK